MPTLRTCLIWCLLVSGVVAADLPAPPRGSDLREALASTTAERDELLAQMNRLETQRSLFIAVVGLLTVAVGFLVSSHLRAKRKPSATSDTVEMNDSDPFPEAPIDLVTATTVTMRKNATITIRNGATQREEVTDQVQTRRFFSSGDPRRPARRETPAAEPHSNDRSEGAQIPPPASTSPERGTRTITRSEIKRTVVPIELSAGEAVDKEFKPSTDRVPRPATTETAASQAEGPRRPVTVRVDHQSDRMEVVEVTVKPGTTGIFRRQGFTILEVMISLAVLATILSTVIASIYTLHRTRTISMEDAQAEELGRLFAERILAEPNWGALNSNTNGNMWITSYSDGSSGTPLMAVNLQNNKIVSTLPALNNLKVFLERYSQNALENEVKYVNAHIFSNPGTLASYRNFYGNLYRIVIQWQGLDGVTRNHVQFIARQSDF